MGKRYVLSPYLLLFFCWAFGSVGWAQMDAANKKPVDKFTKWSATSTYDIQDLQNARKYFSDGCEAPPELLPINRYAYGSAHHFLVEMRNLTPSAKLENPLSDVWEGANNDVWLRLKAPDKPAGFAVGQAEATPFGRNLRFAFYKGENCENLTLIKSFEVFEPERRWATFTAGTDYQPGETLWIRASELNNLGDFAFNLGIAWEGENPVEDLPDDFPPAVDPYKNSNNGNVFTAMAPNTPDNDCPTAFCLENGVEYTNRNATKCTAPAPAIIRCNPNCQSCPLGSGSNICRECKDWRPPLTNTTLPGQGECGWNSMDNPVFFKFSVNASTPQPVSITLNVTKCQGGAGNLQLGVWDLPAACSNAIPAGSAGIFGGAAANPTSTTFRTCNVGIGFVTVSANLPVGNYMLVTDGNAGADCDWTFSSNVDIDVNITSTPACGGPSESVTLNAVNLPVGLDLTTISWTGNPGSGCFPAPCTGNPINVNPTVTSTYVVSGTVTSIACNQTVSATATVVVDRPSSTFALGAPNVCQGSTTTLSYTGTAAAGATFTWNCNGCSPAPGNTPTPAPVSWVTSGPKNVTLQVCEPRQEMKTYFSDQFSPVGTIPITAGCATRRINSVVNAFDPLPVLTLAGTALMEVTVNLTHENLDDVDIYIMSPDGKILNLVNSMGPNGVPSVNGAGAYLDTKFMDGGLPFAGSSSPYTNTFAPMGVMTASCGITPTISSFAGFAGSPATGNWTLIVIDDDNTLRVIPDQNPNKPFTGVLLDWAIKLPGNPFNCCSDVTTVPINVVVSDATFTLTNNICQNTCTVATYSGAALPAGATFNWNFGAPLSVTPGGNSPGPHTVCYSGSGTRNITLQTSSTTTPSTTIPAQTFTSSSVVAIPDDCGGQAISSIVVSGLPPSAPTGITVSLDITHSFDADLELYLQAPNGQLLSLSWSNGGSGDNYTGTVFSDAGLFTPFLQFAPFSGVFLPDAYYDNSFCALSPTSGINSFAQFAGGNPNGTWNLIAIDNFTFDTGTINEWSINFPQQTITGTPITCSASQTNTLTILPAPAAPNPLNNNGPLCAGATLQLTAPVVAGATYTWTGPNSFSSALQNPTRAGVAVSDGGLYSLTVTVGGCTSPVSTTNVVVNAIPATPAISSNSPLCTGQTLQLTAPTVAGATYTWTGPNSFSSALEDPTRASVTASDAGVYSLTVTVGGCTSLVATTTVTINAGLPVPVVSANTPLCVGQTLQLTGPTIAGATYSWTGPNSFASALQNPTKAGITALDAGTYSLVVTVGGCASAPGTVGVTINPVPASPSPVTNNGPLCAGATLNLFAPTIAGATYTWTGPNSFGSALEDPTRAGVSVTDAGLYSVSVTVGGCASPVTTTNVIINSVPATPAISSNSPLCTGQTLNLTAPLVPGATYAWTGPNSFSSALQNPTKAGVTALDAGVYSLTVTVSGCVSAVATTTVTISAGLPAPVVSANTPLCVGQTLQLTGPTVAGATYAWSGPNSFASALQNPTKAGVSVADAGIYTLVITVGGCASAPGTVSVTINPVPAAPSPVTNNGPLCAGVTLNLFAPTIAGATYTWTGPNSFGSALEDPTRLGVGAADAGLYSVSVTVGGCTSPVTTTNVVVNAVPATPAIASNSPLCTGQTLQLTAPTVAGATYTWTGPNSFSSALEDPTRAGVTALDAGDYSLTVTVSGCVSAVATTTVTVSAGLPAPVVSASTPACVGQTLQLTGPTVAGATYAWTGPNSFASALEDPTRVGVTALDAGVYTLVITVGGCVSAPGTVSVSINPNPTTPGPISSNTPLCVGQTLNLFAPTIAGATYTWTGPNSFGSALEDPTRVGVSLADAGDYSLTVTVGGCTSPVATTNVVVNPGPPAPGPLASNSPVCVGSPINFSAPTIAGATYAWTGPNAFSSALEDPTIASAALTDAGTYSLVVIIGGCASSPGTTVVVVNPIPSGPFPLGNNGPICVGQTLQLSAPTIAGATYNWTGPNSFSSNVEDPSIPSATTAATGVYSATVTVGGCLSPVVTIAATVNDAPAPTVTSNGPLCTGQDLFLTITNTYPAGTTFQWTGPNAFNSPLQNPTRTAVTPAESGAYNVQITVPGCGVVNGSINVVVSNNASANPINTGPYCVGQTIQLDAANIAGATYSWTGPNSFSSALRNPTIANGQLTDAGSYTVSINVTGCNVSTASTTVVVNPIPAAPSPTNNGPLCVGAALQLTGPAIAGATYNWTGPNGFSALNTQNPVRNNIQLVDAGLYSLTVAVNGCVSPFGTTNVVVNPTPAAPGPIASNSPLCVGSTLNLTAPVVAGATYSWTGPNSFSSALQNPSRPSVALADGGNYSVTVTVAGCTSAASAVGVIVNAIPAAVAPTNNGPLCTGSTLSLAAPPVAGATFNWTGPLAFTSNLQNPSIANVLTNQAGDYSVTVTVNGCTSPVATTTVVVNDIPAIPTPVGNNGPLCGGQTLNLTAPAIAGVTYNWTGPNAFSSASQNPSVPSVSAINAGDYSLTVTLNGCTSNPATTTVVVNAGVAAPGPLSNNGPLCAGATLNLTAPLIAGATYSWTGPNSFASALQNPTRASVTALDAGLYSLTVTVAGCVSPISTTNVVVNSIPATPSPVTNNGPLCEAQNLQLTAPFVASASYSWSGPLGFVSAAQNPVIPNVLVTNAGNYSVVVTVNGCVSAPGVTSVVINAVPAIPTPLSNNGPLCALQTLNLTAPAIAGATYSWTGPNAITSALQNPTLLNVTTSNAGTYFLTVTVNGCTSGPGSTSVIVNATPSAPSPMGSNGPLCVGQTLNLTGPAIAGATYSWTGPNAFIANVQSPSIPNAQLVNGGTYSLSVTVNGCQSPQSTLNVVINPNPPAPGPLSSNSPICLGQTLLLTGPTVAGATYAWSGPNAFGSAAQNPSLFNFQAVNVGTYSLVTTVAGCASLPGTINVSVSPPLPPLAPVSNNGPICTGSTLQLTAPTVAGATYTWSGPNGFLSAQQNPTIANVFSIHAGIYTVTANVGGCVTAPATTTVTVLPSPPIPSAGSNGAICAGQTIQLTASTHAGVIYSWTGPNGFTSNLQNPTIPNATAANTGVYTVTLSLNGCTSTNSFATTVVTVKPVPAAPTIGNNGPLCEGQDLNLTAVPVFGATYAWAGPQAFTSFAQNPSVQIVSTLNAGIYTLIMTVNGCASPSSTTTAVINATPATPSASNNGPLCTGATLQLMTPAVAGSSYSWSGPNGFNAFTQNPVLANIGTASAGTYFVTITVNNCVSSAGTTNVIVNNAPNGPTPTSNSPVCAGNTLNLAAAFISGATYNWTGPNGFTSALQNPSIAGATVANAGAYGLTITVNGCTSTIKTVNVSVVNPPAAVTIGNNGPLCDGVNLQLTASFVAGATYNWTGPNFFNSNAQNPIVFNVFTFNAGVYSLTVTSGPCTLAPQTTTVTINPVPAPPTTNNNGPLCVGQTVQLTASNAPGATYQWTGPAGFSSAVQNPSFVAVSTANAGVYFTTVTIPGLGCTSFPGQTVLTVTTPVAQPNAGNNGPLCAGQNLQLFTPFVSGATYSWTGPNGFTSNSQNPFISAATAVNAGVYSVIVIKGACSSVAGTTTVTINPIPATPVINNNGPLCAGSALQLTAPAVAGATYLWTGPAGFFSSNQNPSIANVTTNNSGNYNLIVTASGCASAAATTNVVINAAPATPVASNNGPLCEGQTLSLTASPIAGATFSWTGPNGFTSALLNPTFAGATPTLNGVYSITATLNGCTSSAGTTSVTVNPVATPPSVGNSGPICAGGVLNLTAPLISGAFYAWTGPNGFGSNAQNPSVINASIAASGIYSLVITVNGCTSAPGLTTAVVNAVPTAPTVSANSPVCTGTTLNLTASNVAGATYLWNGPNSFSSNLQNPTITNVTTANAGIYTVFVTVNGCTSAGASTNVVINPTPASPTPTSNGPLCVGVTPQTLQLITGTVAGASYQWTGPASFASTMQNPTIPNVTTANGGTYSVVVTVNGCASGTGTINVAINAAPVLTTASANTPICSGQTLNLTTDLVAGANYNWNGPNGFNALTQNPSIANVSTAASGTYSVTASVGGCTSAPQTVSVTINQTPAAPVAMNNGPVCDGGTIQLGASGIAGATYAWTGPNGFNSSLVNPIINFATTANAGVYSVTATVNGCTSAAGVTTVVVTALPSAPSVNSNGPICDGATLLLTGPSVSGAGYVWTGPGGFISVQQNPSIANATTANAGVYNLTITVNGCTSAPSQVNVLINATPARPIVSNNGPICSGQNAQLNVTPVAGATYNWTGPNGFTSNLTNPSLTNVTTAQAGDYVVTATINGCTSATATTTLVVNPTPTAPTASNNAPICAGGTLSLSASLIPGVSYSWSGPNGFISNQQNPSLINAGTAASGTYSVMIATKFCTSPVATTTVVVATNPATPTVSNNGPLCEGQNAQLTANTVAGATYNWTGPNGFTSNQQNPSFTNANTTQSGVYSLTVTIGNCTSPVAVTSLDINAIPATPSITSNGPICSGQTLTLTTTNVSGASYNWTGPNGFTSAALNPQITNAGTINGGVYSLSITAKGCTSATATANVVVNATPAAPVVGSNGPVCSGTTIQLTAANVSGATYAWTGPSAFNSPLQNPTIANASFANFGVYTLKVTVNGCTSANATTTVAVKTTPTAPTVGNNGPICSGQTLVLTSSVVAGATYAWSGPNGFTSAQQNPVVANASGLNAGTYSVTVTVNGCASLPATTTVVVNSSLSPITAGNNGPVCTGQTLSLTASTIAGASYSWVGPNGFSAATQNPTLANVTALGAGTYSVTASIAGCTSSTTTSVVVNVTPTTTASSGAAVCQGETVQLNATTVAGGTYSWTGPNGFTSNQQNPTLINAQVAQAGVYSVTVTLNGCTSPVSTATVVVKTQPGAASTFNNGPLCTGAGLLLNAGFISGATYSWTGPNGFTSNTQNNFIPNVTTANAGVYTLTLNVNGCTGVPAFSTVVINAPSAPVSVGANSPLCTGSTLALTAQTIAGATYNWSGPNTFASTTQNPTISNVTSANAGVYTVTVTTNGCTSAPSTTNVVINATPTVTASNGGAVCPGETILLSATLVAGGTYSWTGPNGFTSNLQNPTLTNAQPSQNGTYSVTVTLNGCTSAVATTVVTVKSQPSAASTFTNAPLCVGQSLLLNAGFVSGATYSWAGPNAFSSNTQNNLIPNVTTAMAGVYTVTLNVNGCTSAAAFATVVINSPPTSVSVGSNGPLCTGATLNLTSQTIAGGTYSWTGPNGFTSNLQNPTLSNVTTANAGAYSLVVTTNGCSNSAPFTTSVVINATPATPTATNNGPLCAGATLQLSTANVAGATYSWTGPNGFTASAQNPSITNVGTQHAGVYSVVVTVNGCASAIGTTNVVINAGATVTLNTSAASTCAGGSASLSLTFTGTGPWVINYTANSIAQPQQTFGNAGSPSPSTFTLTVSPSLNTTYTLSNVTDGSGCTKPATGSAVVTVNATPTASIQGGPNATLCVGQPFNLSVQTTGKGPWTLVYALNGVNQAPVALGNAGSPSPSTFSVPLTLSSNTTVTLTSLTDGNACTGTTSSTLNVTIAAKPTVAWNSGDLSTCAGSGVSIPVALTGQGPWTVNYTANGSPQTATLGNAGSPSSTIVLFDVNPSITTTYTFTSVSDANGCNNTASGSIVVFVFPNPTATLSGSPQTICGTGGTVSLPITFTGMGPWTVDYTFNGLPQPPITSTTTNFTAVLTPTVTGTYTLVTVADNNGCSGPASGTMTVTVANKPVALASNGGAVCQGQTGQLFAGTVAGATYTWTGPNGFSSSLQNPTLTNAQPANGGVYTLIVTVSGCSSNPSTTTFTVKTQPAAASTSNNGPLCSGGTLLLNAGVVAGATYFWTGPNAFTSTTQSNVIPNVTTAMAGVYTVTLNVNGCTGVAAFSTVVINPTPATIGAANNGPVCSGLTINLSATTVAGVTYSWAGPSGFSSALQNPTLTNVQPTQAGVYTVTATVNGCTSNAATTSVGIISTPSATSVSNNGPLCAGAGLLLNAGAVAGATYSWTGPNGFTSNTQNNFIPNVTTANAGVYSLTITAGGCTGATTTTTVVINAAPPAITASNNGPICVGATLNLTTTTVAGATYSWTGPNGFSSALQNPTLTNATLAASGAYSVVVTLNGCTSPQATTSATVTTAPTATISATGSSICAGTATPLSFVLTGAGPWTVNFTANGTPQSPQTFGTTASPSPSTFTLNVTPTITTTYALTSIANATCSSPATGQAIVNVKPLPVLSVTTTPAACGATGSATVTGAASYTLNPGSITNTTGVFNNLAAGTYTVIGITNGCAASTTFSVTTSFGSALTATVTNVTATTAQLTWSAIGGAQSYTVRYRPVGSSTWTLLPNQTTTTATLAGLTAGVTYEAQVGVNCGGGNPTSFGPTVNFTTPSAGGCATPTNITITNVTTTSATVNWTPVSSGAVCYIVTYGPAAANEATWTALLVPHPTATLAISGLTAGVQYGVRVQTNCTICATRSGVRSTASPVTNFTTPSSKDAAVASASQTLTRDAFTANVYPNPNRGLFTLSYVVAQEADFRLYDATGRLVQNRKLAEGAGEVAFDLTQSASGVYLLEVTDGFTVRTIKVVVQ